MQFSGLQCMFGQRIFYYVKIAKSISTGHPDAKRHGLIDRFNNWLVSMYFEVLADLTEDAEPIETQNKEGDQLTVKK